MIILLPVYIFKHYIMTKLLSKSLSLILAVIIFSYQVFAGTNNSSNNDNSDLTYIDESEIYESFAEIEPLTEYISNNENVTYSDLEINNSSLIQNVDSNSSVALNTQIEETGLVIGAFWYGCMFSALGILVVAVVTNNDPEQIKNAVWGCLVSTIGAPVFATVFSVLLMAAGILSFNIGY